MTHILIILFILGILFLGSLLSSLTKTTQNTETLPQPQQLPPKKSKFFTKKKLLTKTEHNFLWCLTQARPKGIAIACKVGLWGVVHNLQRNDWNKISQKHLDFVLYDLRKNDVLLVIELDDPSHLKERAQQRDRAKDSILNDAGIPILRIPTSKTYDINVLREKILARISHAGT